MAVQRTIPIAIMFISVLVSTGCGTDPVDRVEQFCWDRMDSPRSCTVECYAAVDGAAGRCRAQLQPVVEMAEEHREVLTCAMECEPGLACPGRPSLTECACSSACLRERSMAYQDAWGAYVACIDEELGGDCYGR